MNKTTTKQLEQDGFTNYAGLWYKENGQWFIYHIRCPKCGVFTEQMREHMSKTSVSFRCSTCASMTSETEKGTFGNRSLPDRHFVKLITQNQQVK